MTRFVYVLPAGRFRWEVRVDFTEITEDAAEALALHDGIPQWDRDPNKGMGYRQDAHAAIEAIFPAGASQFYRLKSRAEKAARAIAILIGGEVQPHDRRGRIQDPDSYGPDSPRRRG